MKIEKNKIMYFTYENKIDARGNRLLLQEINQITKELSSRKLNGIFISLQNVNYDLKSLGQVTKAVKDIAQNIDIPICFGEFTTVMYKFLKVETKDTYIKLFKTFGLAHLFFNTKTFKKQLKILIFDDNEDANELDIQASLLTKYEHNIIYTKNAEEFKEKITDTNIDFAVSQTRINLIKEKKDITKKSFLLSKKLISNLTVFTDTAVENLETMTGLKANKISHLVGEFKQDIKSSIISTIMKFNGDIEGQFVLIFPKEVALLSVEAMLGEKLKENDIEGISDGVSEFCNIITGGTKTALSKKSIKVLFDLPRTYITINATTSALPKNNGIWINMELEKRPFYMYIIK